MYCCPHSRRVVIAAGFIVSLAARIAGAYSVEAVEILQAGDEDILVRGYSVPSFVDWNDDGRRDLVVGEGSGTYSDAKIRVYLNTGTESAPMFGDFFYVQSDGSDLTCPGSGCLGLFPRVVYWDGDKRKDLLVGHANGTIHLLLNEGTEGDPAFGAGMLLFAGESGSEADIDVGYRATPIYVDWDRDGRRDLVVGALDGAIHIYLNHGTDTEPIFVDETRAQADGADLVVPSGRSSPHVIDIDHDGRRDLITGNTEGQLLFYPNIGSDSAPLFSAPELVASEGVPIDLAGQPRSRPFVCHWPGDDTPDVLLGSAEGTVRLYRGVGSIAVADLAELADAAPQIRTLAPHPNPFGTWVRIPFEVTVGGPVSVSVHDVRGREVADLGERQVERGLNWLDWQAGDAGGGGLSDGVYFVRLAFGETSESIRIVRR